MIEITKCKCVSSFQDALYGKGMRVKNIRTTDKPSNCTICGVGKRFVCPTASCHGPKMGCRCNRIQSRTP